MKRLTLAEKIHQLTGSYENFNIEGLIKDDDKAVELTLRSITYQKHNKFRPVDRMKLMNAFWSKVESQFPERHKEMSETKDKYYKELREKEYDSLSNI